jgi:ribosomal protein S18 acetylase RimI-like enzyme
LKPGHFEIIQSGEIGPQTLALTNEALLDNPIWNSLVTDHAHFAVGAEVGSGLARQYLHGIGPLAGLREPTAEAFMDLAAVIPDGDIAVLFLEEKLEIPAGWQLLRDGALLQMICPTLPVTPSIADSIVALQPADYSEMVALATLTEPGPFREHTADLGGFVGIRVDGRLAAMAGQRMSPAGFAEISAVCTHPDFRGRGYAKALVAEVSRNIHASGRIPFLTSFAVNEGAIRVYRQVGFEARRGFELAVVKPPPRGVD